MALPTIVTRAGKGAALTFAEGDSNFENLRDATITVTDGTNSTALNLNDTLTFTAGTNVTITESSGTVTIAASDTDTGILYTDLSVTTGAAADTSALSYNNTNGVFTFTPVETGDLAALDDFSVTTAAASGAGSLSYNNATGVFTFAPVDTSLVLTEVEEDLAPVLGGNLDVNNSSITTTVTNGDITITANGDGEVVLGPLSNLGKIISFSEEIETLAAVSGTLSIDATEGPIKYVVPSGAMTINGLASPVDGQTVTMLIDNATNTTNHGITLGAGLLTPAGDGVTVTNSGYDLVTITCVDSTNGVYVVTAINDFQ